MVSATNNILLEYIGVSNGLANFSVYGGGTMPTGDYIGIYPENATVNAYNNIEYTAPNIYYINPAEGKTDDYLTDNLLMYTKTKYYHASGDTAFFIPAMTILEVPIRTDSGSYYINNIKLTAIGPSIWWGSAFVKKGKLPDVFNLSSNLEFLETSNTIEYSFSGQGLVVSSIPDTLRLLVWSNINTTGLQYYTININNGMITKKITRTSPFLNSKYYKFPAISIPRPQTGDVYQGGIVCSTYVENGVTHGYVCAANDLTVKYPWSPLSLNQEISITTDTVIGSGETNTATIVSSYGNANYAARVCDNLSLNGFNDWFLPSQDEFNMIYNYLYTNGLANFESGPNDLYWTSSQHALKKAVAFSFKKGMSKNPINKNTNCYIRPIRHF